MNSEIKNIKIYLAKINKAMSYIKIDQERGITYQRIHKNNNIWVVQYKDIYIQFDLFRKELEFKLKILNEKYFYDINLLIDPCLISYIYDFIYDGFADNILNKKHSVGVSYKIILTEYDDRDDSDSDDSDSDDE